MSTTELISDIIRDIAELEGDVGPDYMSATADELRVILERHLAAPSPQQAAGGEAAQWRCFHCDATFTDSAAAEEHFGKSEYQQPACRIDITEYRKMEEAHRRSCEEDTDLHRQMYAMRSDHQSALRREEEKGYAQGLKDSAVTEEHLQMEEAYKASRQQLMDLTFIGPTTTFFEVLRQANKLGWVEKSTVTKEAPMTTEQKLEHASKLIDSAAPMLKSRYQRTQLDIDKVRVAIMRLTDGTVSAPTALTKEQISTLMGAAGVLVGAGCSEMAKELLKVVIK